MYLKNKYNIANTYKSFVRYIKIYRKYILVDLYKYETNGAFYTEKEIDDYIYIVGNKDWFIGIRKDKKIDKYLLPYDKRAYEEFNKYLSLIENSLVDNSIKKR